MMRKWKDLPEGMQVEEVRKYYDILQKHKLGLIGKRIFDIVVSGLLLFILAPILCMIGIFIKLDSRGPVFFRQVRVTAYGRRFRIFKFRTMVYNAEKIGTQVTVKGDARVTRIGKKLRKYRVDEVPQLLNILLGDMTFVGTRPEVEKYVECYNNEMMATLLIPAGVTSRTSIEYKDEEVLLENAANIDEVYVTQVLPEKMVYNLQAIEEFSFTEDIRVMFATVLAVIK